MSSMRSSGHYTAVLDEEARWIFKSETNMYILWYKAVKASRSRFTAVS